MPIRTFRRPWSDIAIDVSDKISVAEALEEAGLNFYVDVVPALYYGTDGTTLIEAPSQNLILRTDTRNVLGMCGTKFKPLQNDVLIEVAQPLIDEGLARLDTLSSFGGGERVWMMLKIICGEEREDIETYLLLMNGHDGSTSVQMGLIPMRIVCSNMLPRIGKYMYKFRHTEHASAMVKYFRSKLDDTLSTVAGYFANLDRLMTAPCYDADEYFKRVMKFPVPLSTRASNVITRLVYLFSNGLGNKGETYWDAFNAITEYLNYEVGRNQETRLNSFWFGKGNILAETALKEALNALQNDVS